MFHELPSGGCIEEQYSHVEGGLVLPSHNPPNDDALNNAVKDVMKTKNCRNRSPRGSSFKRVFVFRNANHCGDNSFPNSGRMHSTLRGERFESGRLPELRRHWICRETSGLER